MIVYHVHYNANTILVKCHNKLFELSYPALRVIRVCGIRPLKAVEVLRVITPVILIEPGLALVHSGIIFHRKQVNMGYAKLF